MKPTQLLRVMGKVAHPLNIRISIDINDRIIETDAKIPFLWMIRPCETNLYLFNDIKWGTKFYNKADIYKEIDDIILNHYDGEKLTPVFFEVALKMAQKQKFTGEVFTFDASSCPYDTVFKIPYKQSI